MAITVGELVLSKELSVFHLVAGEKGLSRRVVSIGILDYEYADEDPQLEAIWTFGKEAFVISSLLFAKDHPERILSAVKGLQRDGVSALAIKTIYYDRLPQEVLDYADQQGFPIFMFGRDDAYFENIVIVINNKIAEADRTDLLEQKIQLLLNGTLTPLNAASLVSELIPDMPKSYCIICYHTTYYAMPQEVNHVSTLLNNSIGKNDHLFRYKDNHLIVFNLDEYKKIADLESFVHGKIRILKQDVTIGISAIHEQTISFPHALQESIYAANHAMMNGLQSVCFSKIGLNKMLMPYAHDYWMIKYCKSFLEPILSFDREYKAELFKTMQAYVRNNFDMVEAANTMHLHKNTVRYRIKKIKDLLGGDENAYLEDQFSIVCKVYDIQQFFGQ